MYAEENALVQRRLSYLVQFDLSLIFSFKPLVLIKICEFHLERQPKTENTAKENPNEVNLYICLMSTLKQHLSIEKYTT